MGYKENEETDVNRISWLSEQMIQDIYSRRSQKGNVSDHQALQKLLAQADHWLSLEPFTVMNKKQVPPSNDKHDYMSLSIYYWPNPDTEDGFPYVSRDGYVNPEIEDFDKPSMDRMIRGVECLTWAYVFFDDLKYAKKAIELLETWFIDPNTRMNPNMKCAQYVPGDGNFPTTPRYPPVYVPGVEGQGVYVSFGGVIEGTHFVPLVNILSVLQKCPLWNKALTFALQDWFRAFKNWLLISDQGMKEASTYNNHGSWYCTQIVAYALFADEPEIARNYLKYQVPRRIEMQIMPDGSQPEELVRADAFHYVVYTLYSFANLAQMAEMLEMDLWNYTTEDGRGLQKAIDWLIPFIEDPSSWTYRYVHPIQSHFTLTIPLFEMAYRAYKDEKYLQVIKKIRPVPENHRHHIIHSEVLS